jgi:hypothetical protein
MAVEEEVFYEGGPHIGDLIIGIILLFFVITIPLGIAAITRALWVRYRISSRRISVTSGWLGRNRLDVVYAEIAKVVTVPRGLGGWGDMVLTLKTALGLKCALCRTFVKLTSLSSNDSASKLRCQWCAGSQQA